MEFGTSFLHVKFWFIISPPKNCKFGLFWLREQCHTEELFYSDIALISSNIHNKPKFLLINHNKAT